MTNIQFHCQTMTGEFTDDYGEVHEMPAKDFAAFISKNLPKTWEILKKGLERARQAGAITGEQLKEMIEGRND